MDATLNSLAAVLGGDPQSSSEGVRLELRLLRRQGDPFLLLPRHPREAVTTLNLYSPQKYRAKLAKALVQWAVFFNAPFPGESLLLNIFPDAPFVRFLCSVSSISSGQTPRFGILTGNARTAGQRLLMLCFTAEHQPVAVIKLSLSSRGNDLLRHEQGFLRSIDRQFKGIPSVLDVFESEQATAFALPFFSGRSPAEGEGFADLLSSWVNVSTTVPLAEIPAWRNLERACASHPEFQAAAVKVRSRSAHPCVQHGDFGPWNIKVSPEGCWTVLDWERGEPVGIPSWDWLHYRLQNAILVKQQEVSDLVITVEGLLASEDFKSYVSRSGISGIERELVLGYLFHISEVIKPSEGLAEVSELRTALAVRWGLNRHTLESSPKSFA